MILDDVRAGFRIDMGGSWEPLGVKPDLAGWSKAIANGHPLAAVTGTDRFREAAQQVYVTGSFWCGATPMAAAVATIRKMRETDAIAKMRTVGTRLREGLDAQAKKHGLQISQTGPVQMPQILFANDPDFAMGNRFVLAALQRGVYMHPWHNMFLCAAMTEADIDGVLNAAEDSLAALKREAGGLAPVAKLAVLAGGQR